MVSPVSCLQATLSQEIHMLDQAESLKKQFGLLSMKAGEMEQRALRAEERANKSEENEWILKHEAPKCLKEGIEGYKKSEFFNMDVVIACRSTFMVVFTLI